MKLKVIEKITLTEDDPFVAEVLRKFEDRDAKNAGCAFDVDEFYSRVKQQYGDVLKKLAE